MRRTALVSTLAALVTGVGCRAPAPPAETVAPTPPSESASTPELRIVLAPAPEGAAATFELSPPRDSLLFAAQGNVRRSAWTTSTAGVTSSEDGLHAEAPLPRVELQLAFDPAEYDRTYPAVTRAGAGAVVYVPALLVEDVETELVPAPGTFVWPPLEAPLGYSYLGPDSEVREHGDVRLIGFDALPRWLSARIEAAVDASLPYYAEALGKATQPPTVIASDASPGPMGFHGDVTANSVIFVRFHGEAWQTEDPRAAQEVAKFVLHEAFHLWNRTHADGAPPWLHEGGAEYAALIAAVTAGVITEDDGRQRLSRHVSRCREHVGDKPLDAVRSGSDVYDCGVAVQWLADLAIRRAQPGRTVLSAWAEVLEGADPNDGYTLASFIDRAGPVAQQFVATTEGRWSNLEATLPGYGVMVSRTPTADDHRAAVLQHLVRVACGRGPIGYWTERDHIKLDTSERCGALAGQPQITKVGGHSILDDASRAFAAVQGACAKGRKVVVTTMQGSKLRVACTETIATPEVMSLADVPKLATGSSRVRTGRP